MKRFICGMCVLALATLVTLATAQGDKTPSVKEIMRKLHKDSTCPNVIVRTELQDELPDWALVQRHAMEFVALGGSLGKNEPPKGDKQSWTKLSAQYLEQAKALDAAAQKKDKTAALAAHTRLNDTCKGCHNNHRPN